MNRLTLHGTVWIASDIHLARAVPRTAQAFYDFLRRAAREADGLILCGDLFDAWIGDDHALRQPPAWLAQAVRELRRASERIPVWVVHGNRDFLLGPAFADAVGARLLTAPVRLDTPAGRVLLAHGDEYCTADRAYQRFRRLVHTSWIQRLFLSLPLTWRRGIADWARRRSQQAHHRKTMAIMDVHPDSVRQALREARCPVLIHGHTHRPAVHPLELDDGPGQRYVLPDWDFDHADTARGGWISLGRDGIGLHLADAL